ncbi:trimeric intracellular cation channel family protein [Streptomyces puniciscabiei]|uniref:trimeric intracellular cation channel family protein n=1 Tax=Streptomyces puniciscabiei TaxID=164348 RepID=UPI001F21F1A2|nr:TRIC cation channel family protein [Streptomyces puniciscabiei]
MDASALSVWAVAGAQKTLAVGLGWLPAVLLGTITAVGGGGHPGPATDPFRVPSKTPSTGPSAPGEATHSRKSSASPAPAARTSSRTPSSLTSAPWMPVRSAKASSPSATGPGTRCTRCRSASCSPARSAPPPSASPRARTCRIPDLHPSAHHHRRQPRR